MTTISGDSTMKLLRIGLICGLLAATAVAGDSDSDRALLRNWAQWREQVKKAPGFGGSRYPDREMSQDHNIAASLLLGVYFFSGLSRVATSYDSRWTVYVAMRLWQHHDTNLDQYTDLIRENNFYAVDCVAPDGSWRQGPPISCNGHWYSRYPVGVVVLTAPLVQRFATHAPAAKLSLGFGGVPSRVFHLLRTGGLDLAVGRRAASRRGRRRIGEVPDEDRAIRAARDQGEAIRREGERRRVRGQLVNAPAVGDPPHVNQAVALAPA